MFPLVVILPDRTAGQRGPQVTSSVGGRQRDDRIAAGSDLHDGMSLGQAIELSVRHSFQLLLIDQGRRSDEVPGVRIGDGERRLLLQLARECQLHLQRLEGFLAHPQALNHSHADALCILLQPFVIEVGERLANQLVCDQREAGNR